MNTKKAQKEVLNVLLKGGFVAKCKVGDNRIFITTNGAHGYVFSKYELFVNIENVKEIEVEILIDENIVKEENLCTLTRDLKITSQKQTIRKLVQGKRNIWIDTKFLKNFEDYSKFYQSKENGLVVITENNQIVGGIMPIQMNGEEVDDGG